MGNFIDYVTLLLVNMTSGLVVLAFFLWWGLGHEDRAKWAPAFGICGLVASVAGLAMTFTWPIPKPYSSAYGEMSVLLGVLFLGAAWSLARGWSLTPLGVYAFVPGTVAIVLGVRFIHLSLTPMPLLVGIGFVVTGCGGIFAGLVLTEHRVRSLSIIGGIVMLIAALIWAPVTYMGYWMHMQTPPAPKSTAASTAQEQPSTEDPHATVAPPSNK